MDSFIISGIQQIGVGNIDTPKTYNWYKTVFGSNIKIFNEKATASLMLPYTANKPHDRHAILALNLNGGGGFEIWQYISRPPESANFKIQLGDIGIIIGKIKTYDIQKTYQHFINQNVKILSAITTTPYHIKHFYIEDLWGNYFEIIEELNNNWFQQKESYNGGILGAVIGVTNIEKSHVFYKNVLGFDKVLFTGEDTFEDMQGLQGYNRKIKRLVLTNSKERKGSFGKLLGNNQIELVQLVNDKPNIVFKNRLWGDCGFIHLCFDIKNMVALQKHCEQNKHPFTIDGGAHFAMEKAKGHFTYIEDPDATLIEFVETKKIPIIKKYGIYLDLTKWSETKNLPWLIIKALAFSKDK